MATKLKKGFFNRLKSAGATIIRKAAPRAVRGPRRQDGYPQTGTGARQGARLVRQRARGLLDFSASNRCVMRITGQAPR